MEALEVMKINIAESFSDAHGSPLLYVVKESAMPGLSGWPIPHDAPYKKNFDFCIRASLEVWSCVEEELIDFCVLFGSREVGCVEGVRIDICVVFGFLGRCGLMFVSVNGYDTYRFVCHI